jgi:hypothetical protein
MEETNMTDFEFEISLDRKTYTIWTIPSEFKRKHGIVDGQRRLFEITLNGSILGTENLKVTSGEELYLPASYQRQVMNRQGVIKFTLKDG